MYRPTVPCVLMTSIIREVVYSIRHHGCPVSDASAAVPTVRVSTVSKIEKQDNRLKSLLHLDGPDDDVAEYVSRLEAHDVETTVRSFTTAQGGPRTYIVLTVAYDESVPSIAGIFSSHNCFQPRTVTVERGFESWPVYHEERVDIASVTEQLREHGMTFDVKRNVGVSSLPDAGLDISPNEASGLTDRQLEVLVTAQRMGYYNSDDPVTMADIADAMDLSSATVCEHLNQAENHIISNVVETVSPERPSATDRSPRTVLDGSP